MVQQRSCQFAALGSICNLQGNRAGRWALLLPVSHHEIPLSAVRVPRCPDGSIAVRSDSTQESRDGPVGVLSRVLHQASSTVEVATQSITLPFLCDLALPPLHRPPCRNVRAPAYSPIPTPTDAGMYRAPEPRSRERFLAETVLSSNPRSADAAVDGSGHPSITPAALGPRLINFGRTFGRIKSSHTPTRRLRDHALQGRGACFFRQGDADLPVSNLVTSGAEVSLRLEVWKGCGSQANKRTNSSCEWSGDDLP